jgi:hypothetical protein
MTDTVMPDFVDALERRLRQEASAGVPARRPRRARARARPRITVALAVVSGLALVALVVAIATSSPPRDGGRGRADRRPPAATTPLILRTATIDADQVLDEVQHGMTVRLVLGPGARLTAARPVRAFGGTAYVLTGDQGWCLTAPDDAIDPTGDPARSGGVTCQKRATVYRIGIPLIVGRNAIAAIPQGVPAPTLTTPDGVIHRLTPSAQGVVLVEHGRSHSVLTLYARDGTSNTLHFP